MIGPLLIETTCCCLCSLFKIRLTAHETLTYKVKDILLNELPTRKGRTWLKVSEYEAKLCLHIGCSNPRSPQRITPDIPDSIKKTADQSNRRMLLYCPKV